MEELDINESRIGNIILNYNRYDKPTYAKPISTEDGKIAILTYINATETGQSRVVLQDLTGAEIKTLLYVGIGNAEITTDEENIYIFTSKPHDSKFYIYDAKTFELKLSMLLGRSCIQSVCCDKNNIYTFDMESGEIQTRNKDGYIISAQDMSERTKHGTSVQHHYMYVDSEGLHYIGLENLIIADKYKKNIEERFGKEIMDLNKSCKALAFDEATQTTYVACRNIIFVVTQQEIKGVLYFQDKNITGINIDPKTKSLSISASNWKEKDIKYRSDQGGSVEILPVDMIDKRIQESTELLKARRYMTDGIEYEH